MKKKFLVFSLMLCFLVSGCTTSTRCGECVGLNGTEKVGVVYKYNALNIALAIIFFETVFVPVVVALDCVKCPLEDEKGCHDESATF